MRFISILLTQDAALLFLSVAALADAASLQDEFKARIAAAMNTSGEQEKRAAIATLFFREGLDEQTRGFADRIVGMLARRDRRRIAFEPLPADASFLNVLDGYEYRPNLEPLGYVVLRSLDTTKTGYSKVPYGLHPKSGRYAFPSTVRTLVNPNASPDRQLQMIAVGIDNPPVTFEGWCEIALSNNTTTRITLGDQGIGNQTRIIRGQAIKGCELTNTSGRGSLGLKLVVDEGTIYDGHVEAPEMRLVYRP